MTPVKRSDLRYRVVITMFAALVVAGFTIPQEVLDHNELLFLLIVLPVMGWLWIQAYQDGMKGN
jgi:hypothetical protein